MDNKELWDEIDTLKSKIINLQQENDQLQQEKSKLVETIKQHIGNTTTLTMWRLKQVLKEVCGEENNEVPK